MVKLKVTARVIPEESYNTLGASTLAGKKFLVIVRDPDESYYVGTLALEIQEQFKRLYKGELGKVKYLKDTDDNDLDPEQLVLDVFVNEGKAQQDGLDQHATICVVQDQRQTKRLDSVVPDLTPAHYLPLPRPPVPRFSQVPSTLGKRTRQDPAVQETPSQHKRSRVVEIAQTQDTNGLARSIEHSPELVRDSQRFGLGRHEEIDQDGNIVKDEPPSLQRVLKDIEPANRDELEWLSERPQDFLSPHTKSGRKRQALHPKINGIIGPADSNRSRSASRPSQLPITPPTDPAHLEAHRRNRQTSAHEQQSLPTSKQRFKKAPRRNLYALPGESDIEDSQMPMPDNSLSMPRLRNDISIIEQVPSRQQTADTAGFDAVESLQHMDIDYPSLTTHEPKSQPDQDSESDQDADVTFTSAKASTINEVLSERDTSSADEESPKSTSTPSEDMETESEGDKENEPAKLTNGVAEEQAMTSALQRQQDDDEFADEEDEEDEEKDRQYQTSEEKEEQAKASKTHRDSGDEESDDEAGSIHHDAEDTKAAAAASRKSTSAPAFETLRSPFSSVARSPERSAKTKTSSRQKKVNHDKEIPANVSDAAASRKRKDKSKSKSRAPEKLQSQMLLSEILNGSNEPATTVDSSMQTISANPAPMSKQVGAARSLESDHDSPGEQLSQTLEESTKDVSIPETIKEPTQNRRPSISSSVHSTPTRNRIGLGITNSPRRRGSIVVDIPAEKGTDKMAHLGSLATSQRQSTASMSTTNILPNEDDKASVVSRKSKGSRKRRNRNRKIKEMAFEAIVHSSESTETTSQPESNMGLSQAQEPSHMKELPEKKPSSGIPATPAAATTTTTQPTVTPASKTPVLPLGMTLEAYEAFRSSCKITEADRQAQRAHKGYNEGSKKKGKGGAEKANAEPVAKGQQVNNARATSNPADEFSAVAAKLSSIRGSDKGSMPPPERKGILKKQSSSTSLNDEVQANGSGNREHYAVNALFSTSPRNSPAAEAANKSRESSVSSTKKKPTKAESSRPQSLLQKLREEKFGKGRGKGSQTSSPAPEKAKEREQENKKKKIEVNSLSRVVQMDGDSSSEESDDDSDDGAKLVVKKKANGVVGNGVDKSIRDPTPEDDSDDSD